MTIPITREEWERIKASNWRQLPPAEMTEMARRITGHPFLHGATERDVELRLASAYGGYLLRVIDARLERHPAPDITDVLLRMELDELTKFASYHSFGATVVTLPARHQDRLALMERVILISRRGRMNSPPRCSLALYDALLSECGRRPQWFYEVARMIITDPRPGHTSYIRRFVDVSRPLLLITDEERVCRATQEDDVVSAILRLYPYALDPSLLIRTSMARLGNWMGSWDTIELLDIACRRRGTNDLETLARFILNRHSSFSTSEQLAMFERLGVNRDALVGSSLIATVSRMAAGDWTLLTVAWLYREGHRPREETLAEVMMFAHLRDAILALDKGVDLTGLTRQVEEKLGYPLLCSSNVVVVPAAIRRQHWEKAGSPAALERFVTDEDEDQLRRRGLLWGGGEEEEEEILVKPAASRARDE
jgi:hypothetical protein